MPSANNLSQFSSANFSNPASERKSYVNSGIVGFDPNARTSSPHFRLGTLMRGEQDLEWIYVRASAAVAANTDAVLTTAANAFTIAAGAGTVTTGKAFAINQYGWVQKKTVVLTG